MILNRETLRIHGELDAIWGGNQDWFPQKWQRTAGCGPTTCANLVWYLSKSEDTCRQLWPESGNSRADMLRLMEEMWTYITPTQFGVNKISIFAEGARRFCMDRGLPMEPSTLTVDGRKKHRVGWETVLDYLRAAFCENRPVAFLNLSNGKLDNLESWHWVLLTGLNESAMTATMVDQGLCTEIDLRLWLKTTTLGGGFVTLVPGDEPDTAGFDDLQAAGAM